MDELEQMQRKAEQFEQEASEAEKIEDKPTQGEVAGIDPSEAAENMAETLLHVGFGVSKLFLDSRLTLGDDEVMSGRESLAPVIEKYNLQGGGDGKIPYWQEITAGLYIGGLIKRIKRALSELKAKDKAEREAKQQANAQAAQQPNQAGNAGYYGEERKHDTKEQPHAVSSEVGLRQEPNAFTYQPVI